jgi:hypothetical protein
MGYKPSHRGTSVSSAGTGTQVFPLFLPTIPSSSFLCDLWASGVKYLLFLVNEEKRNPEVKR